MIDPIEPKTRLVSGCAVQKVVPVWLLAGTFTADEDITLRQVTFMPLDQSDPSKPATNSAILTVDPMLTAQDIGQLNEFQLTNILKASWNLAFPMPKGTVLYWAIDQSCFTSQLISLVFT